MVAPKKFTLKYLDGREEHYENYRYYERLPGNEKITRKGSMLFKAGNRFIKKGEGYWVEITKGQSLCSEFTLEFKDGTTKDFIGYNHYSRLNDENKITRSKGRLYYQGKVFEQVVKDYWTEIEKGSKRTHIHTVPTDYGEITLEYKNGRKRVITDFDDYVENGMIEIKDDGCRMYCDGRIFVKIGENHWFEKQVKRESRVCKFKLVFANGEVKEFENYKKCSERTDSEKIVLGKCKKSLTYHGYRFIRDTVDRHTWKQDTTRFNKMYDKFYLNKDWNAWEFESMQSYFDRDDDEHMKLTKVDRYINHKGKSVRITRCITYKGTRYYNIDNWKTWVNMTTVKYHKEKLNHSNKIPITKFYKEGVWYFTPDKKTRNYRHFLKTNEIYVFSNKYAFWSGALWEKEGKIWYYRKKMLQADKVEKFIIPINEDEYYFKSEIKHLRKMGYKINYRYVASKRQQPNKRNAEQQDAYMKKVRKMSRADRKKALNKKKKRHGQYRAKRGL